MAREVIRESPSFLNIERSPYFVKVIGVVSNAFLGSSLQEVCKRSIPRKRTINSLVVKIMENEFYVISLRIFVGGT